MARLVLLLLALLQAPAGRLTLDGQAVALGTNAPVAHARIVVGKVGGAVADYRTGIADANGRFSFRDLTHAAVNNPPEDPMEHASVREEKGLRPGGFGLLMTRQMVDELLYNEAHNEVVFVKYLD